MNLLKNCWEWTKIRLKNMYLTLSGLNCCSCFVLCVQRRKQKTIEGFQQQQQQLERKKKFLWCDNEIYIFYACVYKKKTILQIKLT
jgi:hypothetical protein